MDMPVNRSIYLILTAFIAGVLLLIFIKYTSDKNVYSLASDNQELLQEFNVSKQLKTLEGDVAQVDSKIRGTVATNDTTYMEGVELHMKKVQQDVARLQEVKDDPGTEEYIDQLDKMVQEKLRFNHRILEVYAEEGKKAAEAILLGQREKRLTDSILLLTEKISTIRQSLLSQVTTEIENKVGRMQRLDTFLIVFVLISAAALFWFITNTIRSQGRLIRQVSDSERKVKEAAKVKENFLANMSHEIRTPLNAIMGFTNLLQRRHLDPQSGLYVQTIQRSGENLLAIINDILDLSKIEAGMMRIELAPFSLRGLAHSIEALFRTKAEEKGIRLCLTVDEALPDLLEGDATRLTQVLVNLIGNALKFTNKGTVAVNFGGSQTKDNQVQVDIQVSDTGIGIRKEELARIFDRFQQADNAITREYGGTGLGLSIVKELVELQGGRIRAESNPGEGTSFYLAIPYRISREQFPDGAVAYTPAAKDPVRLQNIHVLIVEDNEVNQSLLDHLFRSWQVRFDLVNNGVEAVEKLRTTAYDLILMDIQMPLMDGYTATRQIRQDLKLTTPIIAMTAHAMAGEKEKCLSYGMNDYLSKPIKEEQLRSLIAQYAPVTSGAAPAEAVAVSQSTGSYQYIDLSYLDEISPGRAYRQKVTRQFIAAVPKAMEAMDQALQNGETERLHHLAHNLRTTVSVMGLNEALEPYLSKIESGEGNKDHLAETVENIKRICTGALPEANAFLASLAS